MAFWHFSCSASSFPCIRNSPQFLLLNFFLIFQPQTFLSASLRSSWGSATPLFLWTSLMPLFIPSPIPLVLLTILPVRMVQLFCPEFLKKFSLAGAYSSLFSKICPIWHINNPLLLAFLQFPMQGRRLSPSTLPLWGFIWVADLDLGHQHKKNVKLLKQVQSQSQG